MAEDKKTKMTPVQQEDQTDQPAQSANASSLYKTEFGTIRRAPIIHEMEKSYLDYAMSVIVSRALPDVRDGLKPVHRRILYAMRQMGIHWNTSYKKSARIVGEVLGKFHPHGDSAVYDALVRLAQDFSMRYQLIDGQGNFGCFTGDTKVRLADGTSKTFLELINDYSKGTSHFTFTVDADNNITLAPIQIPRLTQKNAPILQITLDNGGKIRCTYNHKFMIRDGSYIEAQNLVPGQALMPLYTRLYNGADKNLQGYEEIYQPQDQIWKFTHRLADAYNLENNAYQKNKGRVRHHIDFHKTNNDPRNIVRLSWQEHRAIHQQHLKELWKDPAFKAKMGQILPALWKQDAFRQKTLFAIKKENQKRWNDPAFVLAQTQRLKALWQLQDFRKKIGDAARKKNILLFGTEEQKQYMQRRQHEAMVMLWQDPEYIRKQQNQMTQISKKLWNTPTHREKISLLAKTRMSTPEEKARISMLSKKMWSSSEYWSQRSQQSIKQWTQPEYRVKLMPVLQENGVKAAIQRFLSVCNQVVQHGHTLTESEYNAERKKISHNLVPRFSWGIQHFSQGIVGVLEQLKHNSSAKIYLNHKVVSVEPAGFEDVYDLTVDSTHNFALDAGVFVHNSVDGDSAAAMRYTEARLSRISEELLTDIEKETVDFVDTFDGSQQEPAVLPSKLPNLLLMGAEGIAVGMATKIPPHNLNEVSLALLATIEHGKTGHLPDTKVPDTEEGLQTAKPAVLAGTFDSEITIDQLMEHVKGPDFPTGGIMYDWNQIKETYALGKGRVVVRAVAAIEEQKNGKFQIIITELPYQVNKSKLVAKIAQLVRDKKIIGISDLRDESDRDGLRVVVDLKKDAKPKAVLNNLYKYTELQSSFSMNMVALNAEGTPQLMNIKIVLTDYIRHRQLVVVRRSQYELKAARDRAHILEGLLIALNHLDEVIETIRKSPDSDTAKQRLMDKFKLSAIQAVAILDMQLRRLAALERQKIEDEYKQIKNIIKDLCTLLSHPQKVLDVIVKEAKEVMEQFGDERRTKLHKGKIGEFSEEDLIANEPAIITVTETGYIKRMSPSVYRPQQRGGVGVTGMTTKDEDAIKMILVAQTHDAMLLFTNKGRVFKLKVHELPESGRQAKGTSIVNLINLQAEERLQTILTMNDKEVEEKFIALATKNGLVKKTKLADYQNIRTNGIIAIILKDNDELVWGKITSGKDHIMLITHEGKSIRFPEGEIKVTARDTQGVRAIMLREQDYVVGVEAFPAKFDTTDKKSLHQLLLVTQNGMGKRTELSEYPVQKRAGQGVKVAEITKKTGNVTGAMMVEDTTDEVVLTTKSAQVIKLALKNIPVLTRPTQGVILMRFSEKDDQVVAVTTTKGTGEEK